MKIQVGVVFMMLTAMATFAIAADPSSTGAAIHGAADLAMSQKAVLYLTIVAGIAGIVLVYVLVRRHSLKMNFARVYVLSMRERLQSVVDEIVSLSAYPDLDAATRAKAKTLAEAFKAFRNLDPESGDVDWIEEQAQIVSFCTGDLSPESLRLVLEEEIRFAKDAGANGGPLMELLPEMIAAIGPKFVTGFGSADCRAQIIEAESALKEARRLYAEMVVAKNFRWPLVYRYLLKADALYRNALSRHQRLNPQMYPELAEARTTEQPIPGSSPIGEPAAPRPN